MQKAFKITKMQIFAKHDKGKPADKGNIRGLNLSTVQLAAVVA
jgi:hypothetical protein